MKKLNLSQGKMAALDNADYERAAIFKWHARQEKQRPSCWYAVRTVGNKTVYLHRFILDAPSGLDVDHKDGDGLNCQRLNLRIATRSPLSKHSLMITSGSPIEDSCSKRTPAFVDSSQAQ